MVVNTFFTKRKSKKTTYSSGGNNSQLDYILCCRQMFKQVVDCKVIPGEAVAKQHKPVVCKFRTKNAIEPKQATTKKTRWRMLKDKVQKEEIVETITEALHDEVTSWERATDVVKESAIKILE